MLHLLRIFFSDKLFSVSSSSYLFLSIYILILDYHILNYGSSYISFYFFVVGVINAFQKVVRWFWFGQLHYGIKIWFVFRIQLNFRDLHWVFMGIKVLRYSEWILWAIVGMKLGFQRVVGLWITVQSAVFLMGFCFRFLVQLGFQAWLGNCRFGIRFQSVCFGQVYAKWEDLEYGFLKRRPKCYQDRRRRYAYMRINAHV